jgi:thioredoxin-like negative regulator of GroEL
MFNLTNLIYKFEKLMTAVTFAEAGQSDTALEIMKQRPVNKSKRNAEKVRKQIDQRPVLRA